MYGMCHTIFQSDLSAILLMIITDQSATTSTPDSRDVTNQCGICQAPFGSRSVAIVKACCGLHRYDLDCITAWFDICQLEQRVCIYCQSMALPLTVCSGHADESNPYVIDPIIAAAQGGNLEKLLLAMANTPKACQMLFRQPRDNSRIPLLVVAAQSGHRHIVHYLLSQGADINAHVKHAGLNSGTTALIAAAGNGHQKFAIPKLAKILPIIINQSQTTLIDKN